MFLRKLLEEGSFNSDLDLPLGMDVGDDLCNHDDDVVILLDGDTLEGLNFRSVLQSMGMQVYLGHHMIEPDCIPLIVLCATNRNNPDILNRLDVATAEYPNSPIIFLTGSAPRPTVSLGYNNTREMLCAAGINFVCKQRNAGKPVTATVVTVSSEKTQLGKP